MFTADILQLSILFNSLWLSAHPRKTKMSKVYNFLISSHLERVPASLFPAGLYKHWLLSPTQMLVSTHWFSSVYGVMQKHHAHSDFPRRVLFGKPAPTLLNRTPDPLSDSNTNWIPYPTRLTDTVTQTAPTLKCGRLSWNSAVYMWLFVFLAA